MKFNLDSIFTYLRKNKYVFLAVFILFIFLFRFSHVREGLTGSASDYDYLAPVPANNSWSDATWKEFVIVYNSLNCPSGKGANCLPNPMRDDIKQFFHNTATEPEAQYYVQNGLWPYNNYVSDYVIKNESFFNSLKTPDGAPFSLTKLRKFTPNSQFYRSFIAPAESTVKPLPLSYQIATGKVSPPVDISTLKPDLSFTQSASYSSSDPIYPEHHFLINMK